MDCLLFYTHSSGRSNFEKKEKKILSSLGKRFDRIDVFFSPSKEAMEEKVHETASKYGAYVVAGGDGTFLNMVNCLMKEKNRPILGFLKMGTLADGAKNFSRGRSFASSLEAIEKGEVRDVDLLKVNDLYSLYMCACGNFSEIPYGAKRRAKKAFGPLTYYRLAIKDAFSRKRLVLEIDGKVRKVSFFLAMNGRFIAGFKMNRGASMQDGLYEAYESDGGFLNGIPGMLLSPGRYMLANRERIVIKAPKGTLFCLDGEPFEISECTISMAKNAIKAFVLGQKRF